jgi:hypothetical protein
MLPILSELPQLGQQPSSRMYHRAAVDAEAGVMYVYGGVHIRERDGARLPADEAAGTLHCYCFHSYTWSTLQTTGKHVGDNQMCGAMQMPWGKAVVIEGCASAKSVSASLPNASTATPAACCRQQVSMVSKCQGDRQFRQENLYKRAAVDADVGVV